MSQTITELFILTPDNNSFLVVDFAISWSEN